MILTISYKIYNIVPPLAVQNSDQPPVQELSGRLVYSPGSKHVFPALDQFIPAPDENSFRIQVKPEEGYGTPDLENIFVYPRELCESDKIRPGDTVKIELACAQVTGRVLDISDKTVTLDTNHPLSGRSFTLEASILSRTEGSLPVITGEGCTGCLAAFPQPDENQ